MTKAKRSSPEATLLLAIPLLEIAATTAFAIMQGSDPRTWLTAAFTAIAALLALHRFGMWAGG